MRTLPLEEQARDGRKDKSSTSSHIVLPGQKYPVQARLPTRALCTSNKENGKVHYVLTVCLQSPDLGEGTLALLYPCLLVEQSSQDTQTEDALSPQVCPQPPDPPECPRPPGVSSAPGVSSDPRVSSAPGVSSDPRVSSAPSQLHLHSVSSLFAPIASHGTLNDVPHTHIPDRKKQSKQPSQYLRQNKEKQNGRGQIEKSLVIL
ncbi:hypothetical protein STEG23_011811 [Scotinomys teguina]